MQNAALLVIDVQKAFDDPAWGQRNNPNAEANIADLLAYWRAKQRVVIHVHHSAEVTASRFHPDNIGHEPKAEGQPLPDEPIFKKLVNSAFIGTELEQYLRTHKIEKLVVVGLTTDHCVSTSVRMAANLGFEVTLVSDATATFERKLDGIHYTADQIHAVHLASLNDEFCQLATSSAILSVGS
ncbi:MAG: cysteine hydrolase [Psychrosphaera sp.]|nr:cysteine hydrolase [Psychrosphaera sp.]